MPEFIEFRDNIQTFASVGAYSVGEVNLEITPPARPVSALVTPELLPTLGVEPQRGRWFTAADSVPNAPPVAILSWELWQRVFGGEESVIGRMIQINGASEQVVGIMPRGFDVHDSKVEIWRPLTINPANFPTSRGSHFLYLVGRLKNGVTREQALADIDRLLNQWRAMVAAGHVPTATGTGCAWTARGRGGRIERRSCCRSRWSSSCSSPARISEPARGARRQPGAECSCGRLWGRQRPTPAVAHGRPVLTLPSRPSASVSRRVEGAVAVSRMPAAQRGSARPARAGVAVAVAITGWSSLVPLLHLGSAAGTLHESSARRQVRPVWLRSALVVTKSLA
jgi:hypothetical protein